MATEPGVIDITDLVAKAQSTFDTWAVMFLFEAAASQPYFAWLRIPIISRPLKYFLSWLITKLSGAGIMQAFFFNTVVRKASQADDYIQAIDAKNALPPTASDDEYEAAEKAEMAAFTNFVMVTR